MSESCEHLKALEDELAHEDRIRLLAMRDEVRTIYLRLLRDNKKELQATYQKLYNEFSDLLNS